MLEKMLNYKRQSIFFLFLVFCISQTTLASFSHTPPKINRFLSSEEKFTVDFNVTFNAEKGSWGNYRQFIEQLRNSVAANYSHNHGVTPIEENPPKKFFDIIFKTNNHTIIMRFRRDNLYLVGYQMEGSNQWLELRYDNNSTQHRIPGSTFLNFGDSYADLTGPFGANTSFFRITVGRRELINAINTLANSTNDADRANSIVVILVMIIESARFNAITEHFSNNSATGRIPTWIDVYLHGWRTLSNTLLHVDADPDFRFPQNNRFGVTTVGAALAIIGILKGRFYGPPGRMTYVDGYSEGRPLVEIFSVTINNIAGNPDTYGEIYGTIKFSDGLSVSRYIYNQGTNDAESIHTGETIMLNGPDRCITADDDFKFRVALMNKQLLSEDDELSKGKILWEVMDVSSNKYNQLLHQQVNGQFGASATVNYAVFNNAVQARIVVTLINSYGGEGEEIDVYGQIAAHNNKVEEESVLFQKADNKYIDVSTGEIIPLSRSVIAVPLDSSLIVSADLKQFMSFGSNVDIANGQATFSPSLSGTYEQYIFSDTTTTELSIKVEVTWDWYVY